MRRFVVVAVGIALAGCATAYSRGQDALHAGRYQEAVRHLAAAAEEAGDGADALTALGIAHYKLGAFDQAAGVLRRALAREERNAEARLYLGLAYLRQAKDAPAVEELRALQALHPHPRLAAQLDRALAVIPLGLAEPIRVFVAASLEDELEWSCEAREARRMPRAYLEPTWVIYRDRYMPSPWGWCH